MKKVLIIGAGFLQDFVICKAKSIGYETLAVDADPNAIGFRHADRYEVINIVDEKACLEYAQKEKIDGVLTAASDYGVMTTAYIAQELGLPGLNYDVAKLIKNKYEVRKRLYERQVDDTKQAYEVNQHTDIVNLAKKLSFPVMVKPCDGSGSRGASRVDAPEGMEKACAEAMAYSITHRAEIETFIAGKEYGAESFVINGEVHVLGIMKKWMTKPPYYAELGHAMPSGLSEELEERVINYVKNAIVALGINFGSVNMDMLITDDGKIHIVDIGARMGGNLIGSHIIPYGTGIDYMANMIRAAVGDALDWTSQVSDSVVTRLLAFEKGVVRRLPDFESIQKKCSVEIYHHLELGKAVNEYHTNLDGCGYIVAKDKAYETAKEKVIEVLDVIRNKIF